MICFIIFDYIQDYIRFPLYPHSSNLIRIVSANYRIKVVLSRTGGRRSCRRRPAYDRGVPVAVAAVGGVDPNGADAVGSALSLAVALLLGIALPSLKQSTGQCRI